MSIVLGDFVSLRLGGPAMRIDEVCRCSCCVVCSRRVAGTIHRGVYPLFALRQLVGKPFIAAVVRRRREAN